MPVFRQHLSSIIEKKKIIYQRSTFTRKEARENLPDWYKRVCSIEILRGREVYPEEFDEDISEYEDAEKYTNEHECEDGVDCGCSLEEDGRSYDGSDAEEYYELKEKRERRKEALLEMENLKKEQVVYEKKREEAAYSVFKNERRRRRRNPEAIAIDSIVGQTFYLFSSEYVNLEYHDSDDPTNRVEFHYLGENDGGIVGGVYRNVYLKPNAYCQFGPFSLPLGASHQDVEVKDGNAILRFNFFDRKYLKLTISGDLRDLVSSTAVPENLSDVGGIEENARVKSRRADEIFGSIL